MNESDATQQTSDSLSAAIEKLFPNLSLGAILGSIAIVIAVVIILAIIKRIMQAASKSVTTKDPSRRRFARQFRLAYKIIRGVVVALAVLTILQMFGIDVTAIIAGLGVVGIIVGFVLQDALSDVVMSFRIVADDYFTVGDFVRFGTIEGEVIQMSSQSTKIRDNITGDIHNISNRNITQITKLSDNRIIDVEVSYEADPQYVTEVLSSACEKIATLENAKGCTLKGLQMFGQNAAIYRIVLVSEPKYRPDLVRQANAIIRHTLIDAHIEIPYGQLDIHMPQEFLESISKDTK